MLRRSPLNKGNRRQRAIHLRPSSIVPAASPLVQRAGSLVLMFLWLTAAEPWGHACAAAEGVAAPHAVMDADHPALLGWIALFDGHTTFGFRGARLVDDGAGLAGGATTSEFADFVLDADAPRGGEADVCGQRHDLQPGKNTIVSRGRRGIITLGEETVVRALFLKPLARTALFNGKNLAGWDLRAWGHAQTARPAAWTVEQGVIRARGGPGALEYAPREGPHLFDDFLAQLVVRTRADDTNGGFFFRNEPGKTMMGYEAQLHNRWYDHARGQRGCTTGAIDDRQQARAPVARDHQTFVMTVVAAGPHIATWVEGYQVTDWTDSRAAHPNPRNGLRTEAGTLQLQAHDPDTDLEFHQVWLQEYPPSAAAGKR